MIIQKVIKGINGINQENAKRILLEEGILCNWWRTVSQISQTNRLQKLTERNLYWHQNHYNDLDPLENNSPFRENTPYISTTAGSTEREIFTQSNNLYPAWFEALKFATNGWQSDGYLFYCYLFIIGKKAVELEQFSEEIRELNIYQNYSLFQTEGEITAKIVIPSVQIEKYEFYKIKDVNNSLDAKEVPKPAGLDILKNTNYKEPESFNNIRTYING